MVEAAKTNPYFSHYEPKSGGEEEEAEENKSESLDCYCLGCQQAHERRLDCLDCQQ